MAKNCDSSDMGTLQSSLNDWMDTHMNELADLIAEKVLMRLRHQHTTKDTISTIEACAMLGCSRRTQCKLKVKYPFIGYGRGTHGFSARGIRKLKELGIN